MGRPVVAIVGRPNVGKSTLFNRLIGFRKSVVHDRPGVTRDRLYEEAEILGRSVLLIDTGGLEPEPDTDLLNAMRNQSLVAIEEADVIVLMVDGRAGWTPADDDVIEILYVLVYRGEGLTWGGSAADLTAGVNTINRVQKETNSQVWIYDAYAKLDWSNLLVEGEMVNIRGDTEAITLPGSINYEEGASPLGKTTNIFGGVARVGAHRRGRGGRAPRRPGLRGGPAGRAARARFEQMCPEVGALPSS